MALYVTPDEVRRWLGVDDTAYDDQLLIDIIRMSMDYIDRLTNTTWNGEVKQVTEYHDITRPKWGFWIYRLGYPVFLNKVFVRQILKLEVWQGDEWKDWISDPEIKEGRDKHYWVDYREGILYLNVFLIPMAGKEIRVTYTYGRDDLPGQIKELCLLLTVKHLLMNERRLFALAEGAQGLTISEQMKWIDQRIKELEELVRAIHIPKVSYP